MKKEKKITKRKLYCTKCGSELKMILVGAEEFYYFYPECGKFYPYSKYNQKTGKRQYVKRYKCPNKKWWNSHTDFMEDEIVTI